MNPQVLTVVIFLFSSLLSVFFAVVGFFVARYLRSIDERIKTLTESVTELLKEGVEQRKDTERNTDDIEKINERLDGLQCRSVSNCSFKKGIEA